MPRHTRAQVHAVTAGVASVPSVIFLADPDAAVPAAHALLAIRGLAKPAPSMIMLSSPGDEAHKSRAILGNNKANPRVASMASCGSLAAIARCGHNTAEGTYLASGLASAWRLEESGDRPASLLALALTLRGGEASAALRLGLLTFLAVKQLHWWAWHARTGAACRRAT